MQFVKAIYSELPNHMSKIFEPRAAIKVKDLTELNINELLIEIFTITTIQTEKRNKDQMVICVSVFAWFSFVFILPWLNGNMVP